MKLMAGDKVIISTGEKDENTGLPIMKVVEIKRIRPVYEVFKPESPNHMFDITDSYIEGVIK